MKWADEIIINDSSTDAHIQICKEYTEKIFIIDSGGGNLNKNKGFGINKCRNDWILVFDAMEFVNAGGLEVALNTIEFFRTEEKLAPFVN